MQYQVPQFLEVEDKLFGFLTFKQFLYVLGGVFGCYIAWAYLPTWIAFFIWVFVVPFSIALAFWKVNNRPFAFVVESFLKYVSSSRLYIWRKIPKKIEKKSAEMEGKKSELTFVPRLSANKLKELAWTLDIKSHNVGGVVPPQPPVQNL